MNQIEKTLEQWKAEACMTCPMMFAYKPVEGKLQVFTSRPGLLIGKGGVLFDKYQNIFQKDPLLHIQRVELFETDPYLV